MASQYDIPWHMLKGLDPADNTFCTLKGSVTTGMEPSARDEIAIKLRSVAYCARGRVFFDVKLDQVSEALKLRSLDHVHVLVVVESKFGFVKDKSVCLRRLRLLPRQLDWKKALCVWQRQSGFQGEPHTRRPDGQLEVIELAEPADSGDPVRDMLHSLQQPVKGTCPEGTETGQGDAGAAVGGDPDRQTEPPAAAAAADDVTEPTAAAGDVTEPTAAAGDVTESTAAAGDVTEPTVAAGDVTESTAEGRCRPAELTGAEKAQAEGTETQAGLPDQEPTGGVPAGSGQTAEDADPVPAAPADGQKDGVLSFRATCYRAGGGKQGHAFTSNEGAENFGGAVQELFNWKVQMKGYHLEVILDVAFDMVTVGLSLTPRALFYRNLAKMGPTSLRSTVCYNLLMMAKPQPYEVVVDPLCGGGSISLEGVQAFPGTFHLCGDNYPDAAGRVALNREFSGRQVSPTVQLAMDVLTWDCTRLPLRDACADVIVSDLPFGKRMGSKFDNRTLYPACMEEMARICTPRYGRAVLLTQDKRTMEKTLHLGRIKSLWRCRASPYVNIGGLDGCAYFLQRTDYVRRRPPPVRGQPRAQDTPAAAGESTGPAPRTGETVPVAAASQEPGDVPLTAADQTAGPDRPAELPPSGAQQPQVPPSGAQQPQVPLPDAQQPQVPLSDAQQPEVPPSGAQQPQVPLPDAQQPQVPLSDAQQPEVPPSDAQQPEVPLSDAQQPQVPPSDAQQPQVPPSGAQQPQVPPSGAQQPQVPLSDAVISEDDKASQ